jgi:superfamily I DNA/RNA helicase
MTQGVPPFRIAAITFTSKAASELERRVCGSDDNLTTERPHISTIHSLALNAIRKDPEGFGFEGRVTPMDDYDQSQMVKKLIERSKPEPGEEHNPYRFLEKLGYHRARGIGFSADYTDEVHEEALEHHAGYHALEDWETKIWYSFEEEKKKCRMVDFDDMVLLVNKRAAEQSAWKLKLQSRFWHVLVDESQDLSPTQHVFVNNLLPDSNQNLYMVGDLAQCQPAGTKVRVLEKRAYKLSGAKVTLKDISELRDGNRVVSWSPFWVCRRGQKKQFVVLDGRKIKTSSRMYNGRMLSVSYKGNTTRVTPNHWFWARFSPSLTTRRVFAVYLMWRQDWGFRVGRVTLKGSGNVSLFARRAAVQKCDKMWLLKITDDHIEAETQEQIFSLRYGIPHTEFENYGLSEKSIEQVKRIFAASDPSGGYRCLEDQGLLFEYPIWSKPEKNRQNWGRSPYFKIVAANLIPEVMELPHLEDRGSSPITSVISENYSGLVYSLDVEIDHRYVADEVPVGNSIYAFQGAEPRLLKEFSEGWRGHVPDLYRISRNHRSLPAIIRLSNRINATMTEVIPLKMQVFRGMEGDKEVETGTARLIRSSTPGEIANIIAREIQHDNGVKGKHIDYKDNAILVRSAIQVRDLEGALVRLRIPYIVRGGRGLLQTEEIKDLLSYFRLAVNPKDYPAFSRAISTPKRGVGDVAIEKIRVRAEADHGGDLLAACGTNDKLDLFSRAMGEVKSRLSSPMAALEEIINLFRYKDYINQKYAREASKARTKCENIDRFVSLVEGLVNDTGLSAEDLVFQLAMERPTDEDDEEGAVTISTIHSAKGLEWRRVYVTNVTEGSIPHRFCTTPTEWEEERRLLYVACTRAKDVLNICVHALEFRGPNTISVRPSRFLSEIGVL